jgi:multidrug efflux pump subunit AcrB
LRTQLATVAGASIPYPFGGKQREVQVDLDPRELRARGLAADDVVNAISSQNLILPAGTQKIDTKEYFIRVAQTLGMNTDQAFFLSTKMKRIASPRTALEIDDHIGFRYHKEMNDNIMALQDGYKMNEIKVHDTITKLLKHHNAYVRMRLFKTTNECIIKDLTQIEDSKDAETLAKSYTRNLKTAEDQIRLETETIIQLREELIKKLNEKRLSSKMKFLIRYTLNNVRPSHVYDGLI